MWHPYYIDALAIRYWDSNVDGDYDDTNEGAHYYLQDANFNVTSIVNAAATVLKRSDTYTPPTARATNLYSNFDVSDDQLTAL